MSPAFSYLVVICHLCMWRSFTGWSVAPLVVRHYSCSWNIHLPAFVVLWNFSQTIKRKYLAYSKGFFFCNRFQQVCNSCVISFPLQIFCELPTYGLWYLHGISVFDLVRFTSCMRLNLIKACLREVCVAVGSPARSVTPWLEFCATEGMPGSESSIFHVKSQVKDLNKRRLELVYYNHRVRVYQPLLIPLINCDH